MIQINRHGIYISQNVKKLGHPPSHIFSALFYMGEITAALWDQYTVFSVAYEFL